MDGKTQLFSGFREPHIPLLFFFFFFLMFLLISETGREKEGNIDERITDGLRPAGPAWARG